MKKIQKLTKDDVWEMFAETNRQFKESAKQFKENAKPDNIEIDRIISRVEVFKILFPNYKHHKIYLGVAAMSFHKSIVWQLHRAGIATIRPIGKKMVVYDKTVRAF